MTESFLPAVLRQRAQQKPDAPAYTFLDYEVDPTGYAETLTWSQVLKRAQVVAAELAACGSPGDRVAICAPQGLEYIVGMLGALEAGFIGVPLSPPMFGVHDERVTGALRDSSPAAVLVTSTVVDDVVTCVNGVGGLTPTVIEMDALDWQAAAASPATAAQTTTALLQYTSGSTRHPAGVVVSHRNIIANLDQVMSDHYGGPANVPRDTTVASWLPFYHDLGLQFAIFYPLLADVRAVLTSPLSFLAKPARWMQMLASYPMTFSGAPNFAFELAVRRTSDADLAGLDLGNVHLIASGAERVQPATVKRFTERFEPLGLPKNALRPGYGLAEATVYLSSLEIPSAPRIVRFDYEKLSDGYATRVEGDSGVAFVSNGIPRACTVLIVDPEARTENPAGQVGEIWTRGDNVCSGYWRNPEQTERTFGGQLVDPSPGTPQGPWLRTGDLGVLSDGELFIVGRIKDLLIVDGRNHYPDDIEATIQEISAGRVAAISVADEETERLVTVVEVKKRGATEEEAQERLQALKREVTAAVSKLHGVQVSDVVLVPAGSIPITTSGKIRRSSCGDLYRQGGFTRVDTQV